MSVFTDIDLERLKYIIEWEDCYVKQNEILESTIRLITRLEAAERVIHASFDPDGMAYIGYDDWHECLKDWKTKAGKV